MRAVRAVRAVRSVRIVRAVRAVRAMRAVRAVRCVHLYVYGARDCTLHRPHYVTNTCTQTQAVLYLSCCVPIHVFKLACCFHKPWWTPLCVLPVLMVHWAALLGSQAYFWSQCTCSALGCWYPGSVLMLLGECFVMYVLLLACACGAHPCSSQCSCSALGCFTPSGCVHASRML